MSSLNWNSVKDLNDINKIIEEGGNDDFEGLDNADKIINVSKTEWGDYMVLWRQEIDREAKEGCHPTPWYTGTPTYEGRYLVSNGYDTSISYFDGKEFIKDFLGFPDVGDIVKWQKIDL